MYDVLISMLFGGLPTVTNTKDFVEMRALSYTHTKSSQAFSPDQLKACVAFDAIEFVCVNPSARREINSMDCMGNLPLN